MQAQPRVKTGGRKAGTPNKPRAAILARPETDLLVPAGAPAREALPDTASPFPRYRLAKVDSLIPYANNARTHSDAQVDKITASLREFGFTNPVLTDGRHGIVAGHGRVLAAKKLGMDVVPTIELSHLSAAQRRAYVLADNRLALDAGWDDDLLRLELGELRDDGFDLGLTGFDSAELDSLFATGNEGLTDPDDVPEERVEVVSRLGDVWVLGKHTLHCADAHDVLPGIPDGSIDFIFTDPPYGHNNNNGDLIHRWEAALGQLPSGAHTPRGRPIANDGVEANDLVRWFYGEAGRLLGKGCCCCCCCGGGGPDPQFARWSLWLDEAVGFKQMVVWDKGPIGMGWHYRRSYETVLVAEKPGAKARWFDKSQKIENIIRPGDHGINKILPRGDEHPTAKPVALPMHFLSLHTKKGHTVLDPFAGMGTTIIAAEQTERVCRAVELDPSFVDASARRWQSFTGQSATLEADGRTFAAIEAERLARAAA